VYDTAARLRALALIERGMSLRAVSMATGINRSTLRDWRDHPEKACAPRADCPRCAAVPSLPEPCDDYAYLLGLYLGDGCISRAGSKEKDVWALRIICADAWPGLLVECARAMRALRPNKVSTVRRQGCTEVFSCSRHWPCLFPQHGSGKKQDRRIELAPWQSTIVRDHPADFVRGLFHFDGWRGVNRVRARLAGGERWYDYPRYMFVNDSADILRMCAGTLDRLGVAWRYSRRNAISVARRDAVARLDEFVGPKY
jgi:hypothetical protein